MNDNESNQGTPLASPCPGPTDFAEENDTVIFDVNIEQMLSCDALISLLPQEFQRLWYADDVDDWRAEQMTVESNA